MKTFVVADCGSAHAGDLSRAFRLIAATKAAGADAAKFQLWTDADKLAARRHAPELADTYRRFQLPVTWLPELKRACSEAEIAFMCTTFLPEDVAVVAPHVRHFKVASFEAQADDLLLAHAPFLTSGPSDRWLIISRGMRAPTTNAIPYKLSHRLRFLLCTSSYPAPHRELQLRRLHRDELHAAEDLLDGFSDHSDPRDVWTGSLAVAAGATIVEAHLRLDDTPPHNPDYPHSMNPTQFQTYTHHIRFTEDCLGRDRTPRVQPSEERMLRYRVGE